MNRNDIERYFKGALPILDLVHVPFLVESDLDAGPPLNRMYTNGWRPAICSTLNRSLRSVPHPDIMLPQTVYGIRRNHDIAASRQGHRIRSKRIGSQSLRAIICNAEYRGSVSLGFGRGAFGSLPIAINVLGQLCHSNLPGRPVWMWSPHQWLLNVPNHRDLEQIQHNVQLTVWFCVC